jgi:hypothetical protein
MYNTILSNSFNFFIITLCERPDATRKGGSEWEPIKILLRRVKLEYVSNSQQRIPIQACQGRVVTTDLSTIGTSLNQIPRETATQEAKDLANLQGPGRTVRMDWMDRSRLRRTVRN